MVLALSENVWLFGAASVVSLAAFIALVMVPAMSSYGRWTEKIAAGFLSVFILGTLVTMGILAGILYVLVSHDITDVFPWSGG
jgi:membrane protein YdbS with pleckstrin-like domain